MKKELTSVYPCTTVAAMTSYRSGISPNEHGWLGWTLYFKEINRIVDTFLNRDSIKGKPAAKFNVAKTLMPYKTIYQKIQEVNPDIECYEINPQNIKASAGCNYDIEVESLSELCDSIKYICSTGKQKFIFAYWVEPDMTMHSHGCNNTTVKMVMKNINEKVEDMVMDLKDTILIILADHGQVDIHEQVFIDRIPSINECLSMPISIEGRAASFFIKDGMGNVFEKCFNSYFSDVFVLLKKNDFLNMGLLGKGERNIKVNDFIGDYIACAKGNVMFRHSLLRDSKLSFSGHHAGLLPDEMLIPLIIVEQ